MIEAFQFEDSGRIYECSVEAPRNAPKEARWWVSISDDRQRYSPFETATSDTKANVKARVIAFYNHRLARIAEPPQVRGHWGNRGKGAPAKPAAAAEVEEE